MNTDITINTADMQDLSEVYRCYQIICESQMDDPDGPQWELDLYPARSDMESYIQAGGMLTARMGNRIIGVMGLKEEPDCVSVHLFGIDPAVRRQGLASRMLKAAEDWALRRGYKKMMLDVIRENHSARTLYEKSGYHFLYDFDDPAEKDYTLHFAMYEKPLQILCR